MRKQAGFALHHPQEKKDQRRRNVFCEPLQTLKFLLFTDEILPQICIFVEIHHIFCYIVHHLLLFIKLKINYIHNEYQSIHQ